MSTSFSFASTLSLGECESRLEEVRKQETMESSEIYNPLHHEIKIIAKSRIVFTLHKRKNPHALFISVELCEVEGPYKTLITCSVGDPNGDGSYEENERFDKVNRNIGIFFLLLSCICFIAIIFTLNNPIGLSMAIVLFGIFSLSGLFLFRSISTKRQRNEDVKELVNFIKKLLEAK
jgi:hypothetical protein